MKTHSQNTMWALAWIWLVVLFCNVVQAAVPDWQVVNYPIYTGVWARVKINGVSIRSAGSKLAAFYGDELRGVAVIRGTTPEDDIDGEYYFNLLFGANGAGEKGFSFKLWNAADDKIYDIDKTLDFDINYPQKPETYGGIIGGGFAPCIMNAVIPDGKYTLTVTGGKINGTSTSGKFAAGEEVSITATLPSNQGLKVWTPSKDVEFIGSRLAATTTIVMPAYDVTVAASFVNKSDMPAVSVRSTTNSGDDTAKEPSSSTGAADKGKFTFTRTNVNVSKALTVYYSIRGTAVNGTDYKTIASSVTFAANATSVALDIEPLFDGTTEGDETVEVVLEPESGTQTYRGGTVTDAMVTIEDTAGPGPVEEYTVTVVSGTVVGASGSTAQFAAGTSVTIRATTLHASANKVFNKWTSDDVTIADVTSSTATFTMPSKNVTVTATYKDKIHQDPVIHPNQKYTLTVSGGKINGTSASGQFIAGEEVTITVKIWTPSKDVEFVGSRLAATTTIKMPAYDVTVAASFVNKSDMPAVSVRSTTNTGDDTAKEPSSSTGAADKGKFTFTRTSVNQSKVLTVYYSVRGTAVNGTDYKTIASSVTFAANATSVAVEIEPLFDGVTEGDDTVTVVLEPENGTQTYRGGTYTDATVTILHDAGLCHFWLGVSAICGSCENRGIGQLRI